jgi:hypothetical protein
MAKVEAMGILLCCLFGNYHLLTASWNKMSTELETSPPFFDCAITEAHGTAGYSMFLRSLQTRLQYYFVSACINQQLGQTPEFRTLVEGLKVRPNIWATPLPLAFQAPRLDCPYTITILGASAMTTRTSTPGGTSVGCTVGSSSSTTTPTNQAAVNPSVNPLYATYQEWANTRGNRITALLEAFTLPRPPPQIKRQGMLRPSCIVYHVKGQCHRGCACRYDHAPHTPAEDDTLLTFVREAYNKKVGTNSTTSN